MQVKNLTQYTFSKNYKQLEDNYHAQRQKELETTFQAPEYWQILQRAEESKKNTGRILKLKSCNEEIPVSLKIESKKPGLINVLTTYSFYDGLNKAGYVKIGEYSNGAYIAFVKKEMPKVYGGIEKLALKIAVANCLKRNLKKFEITGDAIDNSHAIHYLAGMRFNKIDNQYRAENVKRLYGTDDVNKVIKSIIQNTPNKGRYYTSILGCVKMYMKKNVIKNIIEYLKQHPVLF